MPRPPVLSPGISTSLDSIQITPRTPRSIRSSNANVDVDHSLGSRADTEELEMSLLEEDERRRADAGFADENGRLEAKPKAPLSLEDKRALVLLCILYLIQGVPIGLALGSIPFILREHLSYSQLGTFALSGYPYSLKLLWSPIVDAVYFTSVGRRKSWIIPMQIIIGSLMLWMSFTVQDLMNSAAEHVIQLTFVFTTLVLIAATQDIAVDGWALTLLSEENLSYASTCQTIGLNTGYFASFTVFLALNSEAFSAKWGIPVLTLSTYLRFWSIICFCVTIWLAFFQNERKEPLRDEDTSITGVYKTIWSIIKLKHVQSALLMYLVAKIGWAAHDAATSLKMVEKGLGKEDLAVAVLIDFPFQILGGYLAARWSRGDRPLRPWIWAFWPRLGFAFLGAIIIWRFPKPPISTGFFAFLVLQTVLGSFASTIQFVGLAAFHTRISDPAIGGTYMTLLNTFTNLGGTWPKYFVLKAVDLFSIATCEVNEAGSSLTVKAAECVSEQGKARCSEIGGTCITERDGYYITTGLCLGLGVITLVAFIIPTARKLQALPVAKWRIYS
ncbi:acetyl-coenzyme A transporter 1-domain-containing protein [Multifurca ochricompacta]|uniref:Acetyl-coenzyme A transporter 1-domain-containing protein n=1 Tax=Multifurca ochricompacta TaxID=376703 RepID=A0AAD4M0A7_9AGAM|nr:acetyl-coenzyme A transporter 1-domain-containing protein [Multifurca ochricompacta]